MRAKQSQYAISALTRDYVRGQQWHEIVIETPTIKNIKTYDLMRENAAKEIKANKDRMVIVSIFKVK